MAAVFEDDWSLTDRAKQDARDAQKDKKVEAKLEAEGKE